MIVTKSLNEKLNPKKKKKEVAKTTNPTEKVEKVYKKYSNYSTDELKKKKKDIQNKMNIVTGADKNADGKIGLLETFREMYRSAAKKSNTDSKEYKTLSKEYKDVNNALNKKVVDEAKITTVDKITDPIFHGAEKANEGLNTTIQKIRNIAPDVMKTDKKKIEPEAPTLGDLYDEKIQKNTKSKIGKVYHDLAFTTGNMLPAIVAPTTSLSLAATGATTFGNSYKDVINEGKTDKQATKYGLLEAGKEVGLQKAIGGLSGVYGESALGKVTNKTVNKYLSKIIKNPNVRKYLSELGGEFSEEYLQEILEPVVRNAAFDENNKFKPITKEALYSGLLGALNAGLMNSPQLLNKNYSNQQINQTQDIINQKNEGKIDAAQANEMLKQVREGTYNQNQIVNRVAQERVNEISNNSNLTQGQKADIINAVTQTLEQQRSNINSNVQNTLNNESLRQDNRINQEIEYNPEIKKEIDYKTKQNFKSNEDVSFIPVNQIESNIKNGGYRTNEQVASLEKSIKQNGISSPIEISIDNEGKIQVTNGNHRLEIAKKYGLEEVPVKFSSNLDLESNQWYNSLLEGRKNNEKNGITFTNEKSKNESLYNKGSNEVNQNSKSNTGTDRLYKEISRFDNGPSVEATRSKNDIKRLGNSSFYDIDNNNNLVYNKSTNTKEGVENDFRKLQEESRRISKEEQQLFNSGNNRIDEGVRERLSRIYESKLQTRDGKSRNGNALSLKSNKNTTFNMYDNVDAQTFHDIFEINKKYLRYGELVDLHDVEDYKNTKNYISNDGLSGFAITKDGDLISVFNLDNKKRGFLSAIAPVIKENAKTLDCYASPNQPLNEMYEKMFGFKTASIMDYNMEYDHDNIAANHGNPSVAFMVNTDQDVETKHFNKDQYDEAVNYRNSFVESDSSNNTIAETKSDNVITVKDVIKDFEEAKEGKLDGKKLRSWVETSNEATGNQNTLKKANIDKITYEVQSNKKTFEKAQKNIEGLSYEEKVFRASDKLNSNKRLTAVDLTEAQLALREAATKGDIKTYLNLQQDIAIMGTELGQSVQAMSMIQKMSPDGQIAMLNKIVDRQQKLGNKNWQDIELNEDLVQKVLDSYDDATHTTYNQEKLDKAVNDLKQDIADQMKTTWSDKANEWRYLSMLGNPKTHIRNVVANVAMSGVKAVKDFNNSLLQDILIKDKSNKTTTLKSASEDVKSLAKVISDETFKGENTNKYNEKNDIESKKKVFNNKVLESARKINMKALDVEDRIFKERNFKKSFAKYLTAQGITTTEDINTHPEIVQQAKNFALEEAKIATFQQDNNLASWLNSFDNKGKVAKVVRGAIIPFTRTPLNIAKTGIEYTPGAGLVKTISDFKKAPNNMKGTVLIDGISKQITGTSLALVGYALAKSGLVKANTGDDKDDKLETDQGMKMGYSIKIGDTSYDLSWLSPSSMPFFVGASMFEQLEKTDGWNGNVVMEALAKTLDPLSEMSCISSFTDVLKSYNTSGTGMISDMAKSTSQNYISQFIPTLSSQFARLFDDKKRSTYADKNSSFTFGQETTRQLMYKIPGLRNKLSEQTDYLGNTKKENDNIAIRAFESFLSPSNTKKDSSNKTTKYLLNLYSKTGESGVLPGKIDQYVKYKDKKYDMTQKEYNSFKKNYGTFAYKELQDAINSDDFKELSKDKQAKVVSDIMEYSKFKAKEKYLKFKNVDYTNQIYSKAEKAENSGYAIADYYITKQITKKETTSTTSDRNRYQELKEKGIDGKTYDKFKAFVTDVRADKNAKGNSIPGSKKRKIINYIQSLPLTAQQKQNLYDDYKNNQGVFTYYK